MKQAQDLEKWFKRHTEFLYWVVYEGVKGRGKRKGYVKANVKDITEAFNDFLDFTEEELSDGEYTVCLRKDEKATKGEVSESFIVGEPSSSRSERRERDSVGIGGLSSINGLQFIAGLMNAQSPEVNRLRDENTKLQLELLEKKFELKEKEKELEIAGIETDDSWSGIIKGIVKDYFPDILDKFPNGEKPAHVQSLRGKKEVPRKQEQDPEDEEQEEQETNEEQEQKPKQETNKKAYAERIGTVLKDVCLTFKTKDPVLVLEVVLDMLKNSEYAPMIKGMINKELKARTNVE